MLFFVIVAIGGCGVLIYQSVEQYTQYGVITTTKIKREAEMTFPGVTICSYHSTKIQDMIIGCGFGIATDDCKMINLTLYSKDLNRDCVQLNYNTVNTELQKAVGEGPEYGYSFLIYHQFGTQIKLAVINNNARVAVEECKEEIYPGRYTEIALTKTVQAALGPPYSSCNESAGYRQVSCGEDCYNKIMSENCGCDYPLNCKLNLTNSKCSYVYWNKVSTINSLCKLQCPAECNKVSFALSRVDVERDLSDIDTSLDFYKTEIEKKFGLTGLSDNQLKKELRYCISFSANWKPLKFHSRRTCLPLIWLAMWGVF